MILILSHDAVAAALLGAMIEVHGHSVSFARPPENPDQAMRRVRPMITFLDADDPASCNAEILGHLLMRRISVVVFGTHEALERVRALTARQQVVTLPMPPDAVSLDATLARAMHRVEGSVRP